MSEALRTDVFDASRVPLVSVGMPVYNGENYIAEAIDSVLKQTFHDFELIICDNASTDRTGEICELYAARDPRVRYHRNAKNLGAGPNYDRCFELSRGRYFKWAAHDDLLAPDFLEKAMFDLEKDPTAVLWATEVVEIGPEGEKKRLIRDELVGCDSPSPSKRLSAMMTNHRCTAFFGVFRREALVGTQLHGTFADSDRALLAEISLRGRIIYRMEPLFFNREHPNRYTSKIARGAFQTRDEAMNWLDTSQSGSRQPSHWIRLKKYWTAVGKHVKSPKDRIACYGHVVGWLFAKYTARNLLLDAAWAVNPKLVYFMLGTKRRLFGVRQEMDEPGRHETVQDTDRKV